MKRQRRNLSLPAIRKFREAIAGNDLGGFLIDKCERCGAGSCKVKYKLKETLLALILIVTFSAHIFTNAILKNMKKMNGDRKPSSTDGFIYEEYHDKVWNN